MALNSGKITGFITNFVEPQETEKRDLRRGWKRGGRKRRFGLLVIDPFISRLPIPIYDIDDIIQSPRV